MDTKAHILYAYSLTSMKNKADIANVIYRIIETVVAILSCLGVGSQSSPPGSKIPLAVVLSDDGVVTSCDRELAPS